MDRDDWEQIKDLFAEAIELPPDSRLQFVKERTNGKDDLFSEVASLLNASAEPDNLIERNAIDLSSKIGTTLPDYTERHFGNYRIIRELGTGGMGSVFLAERDDGEFKMLVALKIVKQSVADTEIIARFRRERQILADLKHPNIAVLYDGGISEKGEPFLAMEYVDGQTFIEYCDSQRLSTEERLRLFIKVCSAVAYAHRNLVVHRDIKPSNILVNADGEPKLLDFGLAKAFESDSSTTQTALRAFTPAYASPEQIMGKPVATASDQYSLGVVLFELLSGSKPFAFEGKGIDEIIKTIGSSEAPIPSVVASSRKFDGHDSSILFSVAKDLDNITLKALRKEPERRYPSVDAFAEDIERYLNGLPVSARPATLGYLASRFIQRNKITVAAAAIVLIAVVAGLAVSIWQGSVARRERDRAERRFQEVRQLSNSLLFEIAPKIERLPGSTEARELLVIRALSYLDNLANESRNDPSILAELASAYEKIGDLQGNIDKPNLSDYSGAISSFEKARTIRESLPADAENQLRLAQGLRVASSIRNRQNDVKGALGDADRANMIYKGLLAETPDSSAVRMASIQAEIEHGQIFAANNQFGESIPRFQSAINELKNLDQRERSTRILSAKSFAYLGNALSWDGQQPEAESEMAKAIASADSLISELPGDSEIQAAVWQVYTLASSIYEDSQDQHSLELAQHALLIAQKASNADNADSQARYNLARAFSRVGIMFAKLNRLPEADTNLQSSQTIFDELIQREPRNIIYQRDLAKLHVRMGDTSEKRRNMNDALAHFQRSAAIFESLAAGDKLNTLAQRDLAQSLKSVAKMQIALSQKLVAVETLRRARSILEKLKQQNALGKYDQQLVDDVEKTLASIS